MKEDVSPDHFCKVLITPGLGVLPVPETFRPYLGEVPAEITLRTNIGCVWTIILSDLNGKACLHRGRPDFTIAHDLHIGYLLMFKKIAEKEFRVIIFNKSGCEVVKQCSQHPENLMKKRVN